MKILYNIPSLRAHSNMVSSDRAAARSSARLSSGLRISKASDSPAGNAIANRLLRQAGGTAIASRSSADVMSVIQTAESSLNQVGDMLQRMRQLSLQAANGHQTLEDTQKIQLEIESLADQIHQTSGSTEFNRIRLFSGEAGRLAIVEQPAAGFIEVLQTSHNTPIESLGFVLAALPSRTSMAAGPASALPNSALDGQVININGMVLELDSGETELSLLTKLDAVLGAVGFEIRPSLVSGSIIGTITAIHSGVVPLEITAEASVLAALGLDAPITLGTDAVINGLSGLFGTTHTITESDGNLIRLRNVFGHEMRLAIGENAVTGPVQISMLASPMLANTGANSDVNLRIDIPRINARVLGIDRLNVMSPQGAQGAIVSLDTAIAFVAETRARLGANQNRLQHVVSALDASEIDLESAASRIRDTDMALEITNFTRNQIIFQAGAAILAQSNARPQAVLQLLPM